MMIDKVFVGFFYTNGFFIGGLPARGAAATGLGVYPVLRGTTINARRMDFRSYPLANASTSVFTFDHNFFSK
jgi:hypothetical protein